VRAVGRRLAGKRIIFKKVDTALRVPSAPSWRDWLKAWGATRDRFAGDPPHRQDHPRGVQYEGETPVDRTPYAADPVSPVTSADIREVIARTGGWIARCATPKATRICGGSCASRSTARNAVRGVAGVGRCLARP